MKQKKDIGTVYLANYAKIDWNQKDESSIRKNFSAILNSFKSWIPGVTSIRSSDQHQDEHELSSGDEPETSEARNAARCAARRSFRATRQRRTKQCATSNITGLKLSSFIPAHRLRVTPGIKVAMGDTTVLRRLRHQLPKRLAQVRRLLTTIEKRLIKNSPIYQQLSE